MQNIAPMLTDERKRFILQQLEKLKKVEVMELATALDISTDTVRRDLIELEREGKLTRVHGGALAINFHQPFLQREVYAQKEKIRIATKALTLIRHGMDLVLGGGTVMVELARIFPENISCTVFTVSPLVALEIAQRSSARVILMGGTLTRDTYVCTGAPVISQLSEIRVDLAFLGTNGFSLSEGVTEREWEVAQVKKAIIRAADSTALLCLSENLDVALKIQVCPCHSIDYLVTEKSSGEEQLSQYTRFFKIL